MSKVITVEAKVLSREQIDECAEFAEIANTAHDNFERLAGVALDHAHNAGDALAEAKSKLAHGSFEAWVAKNVKFSARTARMYLRIAANWDKLVEHRAENPRLTIRDAIDLLTEQREPVTKTATVAVLEASSPKTERVVQKKDQPSEDSMPDVDQSCEDDSNHEPEPQRIKSRGVGVELANDAINVIRSIPRSDALRADAFDIVARWIAFNHPNKKSDVGRPAMSIAQEAVNLLRNIPLTDVNRKTAFQFVLNLCREALEH